MGALIIEGIIIYAVGKALITLLTDFGKRIDDGAKQYLERNRKED